MLVPMSRTHVDLVLYEHASNANPYTVSLGTIESHNKYVKFILYFSFAKDKGINIVIV